MNRTIFAVATAPGRSAVAVVRISGPGAANALTALAGPAPAPRRAVRRRLVGPDGDVIDEALVLWFPSPHSYTGEDVAELQVHGGPAVIERVIGALASLGVRPAEPGEFTRRAFEAGRLDLDQAEAVADLIDAETEAQARQALAQLEGALGQRYAAWRGLLTEALAQLEAAVDFPDEDVPADVGARAAAPVGRLVSEITAAIADSRRGERVRQGYRIALVGAPNAGKSRLFNALLRRDAAIVTASPGTTRDVIEAPLVLGGYKALLADMAGLRDTAEAIEEEGVRRATAWAGDAALRLWVIDGSASDGAWREAERLLARGDILVVNKSDLRAGSDAGAAIQEASCLGLASVACSAATKDGLSALEAALAARVVEDLSGADFPAVTRERHAGLLSEALAHLQRGAEALRAPELAAEDLRLAGRALERITGRIGAEDVLDVVFASFCIGK
jgi:tRNA modification GTPase